MDLCGAVFKQKSFDENKLLRYGFTLEKGVFRFSAPIMDGFLLQIVVQNNAASCNVVEISTNEPFALFNVDSAQGAFVGKMRVEAEAVLQDIAEKCCRTEIFKGEQTKAVIDYAKEKYGSNLEFLWEKFSDNAVLRRDDNKKWYAVVLTVQGSRLGLDSEERMEVLDLRGAPEEIQRIVDGKRYFLGYHMNKKHWFTICLDGSVETVEIFARLDDSFALAKK